MNLTPAKVLLLWLVAMAGGVAIIANTRFVADMSFFLPAQPSPEQQVLVEQMKDGAVSRLLMVAVEGGTEPQRAQASRALRAALVASGHFRSVQNGEADGLDGERVLLLRWRYHLSPAVSAEHFSINGLREAISRTIDVVSSPAGYLFKPYLLQDPTGELIEIVSRLHPGSEPDVRNGVWFAPNGDRALLLAQTRAAGADTDGQEAAIADVRAAFDRARAESGLKDLRVIVSGPGVFAVQSRESIRDEVTQTSIISTLGITLVLIWVYRSVRTLAMSLLPVLTGAVAGVVVVRLVFGNVHGITVGFGAALIGEAVDYAVYFCVQSGRVGLAAWRQKFWPTIRLGVLTSVAGFAALLLAGFPGLAQLGLYALTGVATAALMTRYVLPLLARDGLHIPPPGRLTMRTRAWLARAPKLRTPTLVLAGLAALYLSHQGSQLWSTSLSALSTVSAEAASTDAGLRADVGAPDARYLVIARARDREAVLQTAERAGQRLDALVSQGRIGGYDSPARFLPSRQVQSERLAALPPPGALTRALTAALQDAPLNAERLKPFVNAVEMARNARMLDEADLSGSAMGLAVDALLSKSDGIWTAVLPLRPVAGALNADMPVIALNTALAGSGATLVDLKAEFEGLYARYLRQALTLSVAGVLVIVVLLAFTLRSAGRLARVVLALTAAVALVVSGLSLAGVHLNLLHLVGMLLIVAIGSNYALFFDQADGDSTLSPDVWLSLAVASTTTAIGFGALALSRVPVLQAIGVTVTPGIVLALLTSAVIVPARAHGH